MITKTKFYDGDYRPFYDCKKDVQKMEAEGWAVRQILQSNGVAWVVVYEREEGQE